MRAIDLIRAATAVALVAVGGPVLADVYSWVDESGVLNFGNVDPPAGVSTQTIVKEQAQRPRVRDPGLTPEADVRMLNERIRQLEAQSAERSAYPPAGYPPPPPMTYAAAPAPTYAAPAPAYYGPPVQPAWSTPYCDPSWSDCFSGWGPTFSSGTFAVFGPPYRGVGAWHHAARFGPAGRSFGGYRHR